MKLFLVPSKIASDRYPDRVELLRRVLENNGRENSIHIVTTATSDSDENEMHVITSDLVVFALTRNVLFQHAGNLSRGLKACSKLVAGRGVHEINEFVDHSRPEGLVVFVDEPSDSRAHFNAYKMPAASDFERIVKANSTTSEGPPWPAGDPRNNPSRYTVSEISRQTIQPSWQNFAWADWKAIEVDLSAALQWPSGKHGKVSVTPPGKKRNLAIACGYLRAHRIG